MNWFQKFMRGRYGMDALNWLLLFIYMIIVWIARWQRIELLSTLGLGILVLAYFRIFSKNTPQRYRENQVFLQCYLPVKLKFRGWYHQVRQNSEYKYFTCPQCKQKLRVPRGRGKITVTCSKCKNKFDGRS